MAYAMRFQHQGQNIGVVSNENDENYAILRGFQLLIPALADDYDRQDRILNEVNGLKVEEVRNFTFTSDARHYRSEVRFCEAREISYEAYEAISQNADIIQVYA